MPKNRCAVLLAPGAEAEAILAANAAAAPFRDLHLAAVQDVDGKAVGTADRRMERSCAIDADDHRRRLHAHCIDRGRRHRVPSRSVPAGDDGDRAREPAQGEPGLRGQICIRGNALHAHLRSSSSFSLTPYRTVRYSVLYVTVNLRQNAIEILEVAPPWRPG